ncbi:MAG: hypothetical protein UU48_C0014G0011 [Candidatus Uhrbacteria bacterium GW2011_GWF2_41_16]|uniref:Uncharacterized protein n=2 Tax=Candidatus Uhriibacteriota TaxID=1752732 RepID=A0A0G0V8V8_9BACT|nr:MAG: hypothetical protein UU31_C0014G0002 [Candidatus Uhrbacteria bacterium GW2011_GWA2_41_10]KKR86660.1 MAG: hypothetical protein UU35_C0010G0038 [Candidatus Uhrbacteria bacterium GW2011_GWC2_41_11]KKR97478.1 MAG: hypothetical protein UU48_C0014G0011 [Candidatus Uhrbacteria bacterium GW2011_GWF2_41_16]
MVEFLDVDREGLFEEIVERGREEGVSDEEGYHELIDAVIEEHRGMGEIHDDTSYQSMAEALRLRWSEYREALGVDESHPTF